MLISYANLCSKPPSYAMKILLSLFGETALSGSSEKRYLCSSIVKDTIFDGMLAEYKKNLNFYPKTSKINRNYGGFLGEGSRSCLNFYG